MTVLRDGAHILTSPIAEVTQDSVVRAMVGRELLLDHRRETGPAADAAVALAVSNLTRRPVFSDMSLSVRAGEIVGLFGLIGSGRTEVLETLFGLHAPDSGTMTLYGQPLAPRSPVDAIRAGVVLVPEARHSQGLLFNLDLRQNLQLSRAEQLGRKWIEAGRERTEARGWMDAWRVKAESPDSLPDSLSGGNQQKVLIAKWVATTPRVLLLDEPTRGVDVGAKAEIHRKIQQLASEGLAVLVVSSDLPEVLTLADRVLVMREGRLRGELPGAEATEEAVMHLATTERTELGIPGISNHAAVSLPRNRRSVGLAAAKVSLARVRGVVALHVRDRVEGAARVRRGRLCVTETNKLVRFDTGQAGQTDLGTISGTIGGEQILSIDFRPLTGRLYGVSANDLYTINPVTAQAQPVIGRAVRRRRSPATSTWISTR